MKIQKTVGGIMQDETTGVAIKRLNPKMYLFLVDDNSVHRKVKDVNKTGC